MNAIAFKSSPSDKAYAFIKEAILSLRYQPGEPLRAQDFADQLDVSRTPVREALGRLQQEGLALRDSGWGYVVRKFTVQEVSDLYRVRETLELEAVTEAVERADPRSVKLLGTILERAAAELAAGRLSRFQALCRQFHELIAEATGNSLLQRMIATISDQVRFVAALVTQQHAERAAEILNENRMILAAIESRDIEEARAAVRNHIHHAAENLFVYFADRRGAAPLDATEQRELA